MSNADSRGATPGAALTDHLAAVVTIARLSLLEALRRRLLWALVALTALLVVVTAWAFQRLIEASPLSAAETTLAVSQLLILMAFMFSFVLAMTAVFVGSPSIAAQVESGEVLALLARPIRRADLVLGRWLASGWSWSPTRSPPVSARSALSR